jgi:hypothetical protein
LCPTEVYKPPVRMEVDQVQRTGRYAGGGRDPTTGARATIKEARFTNRSQSGSQVKSPISNRLLLFCPELRGTYLIGATGTK